ncbi:hypothetical protein SAY87_024251 [Trapa incisa]|uniref:Late embryogenesis abundant protein n=1 Tax=Trapa incisa TaxID=236973 RepID=A0AAN7JFS6_9MYRT|nr:hypothetical protein SAY87_024251 [Trapa incisa]
MAACLRSRGIGGVTKRVVSQIWSARSPDSLSASALIFSRTCSAHASVYDKNPDEHVRPAVVPDEVIQPESHKYWAPHPKTGVFGPTSGLNQNVDGLSSKTTDPAVGEEGSVLEQKAWFRPTSIEDSQKSDATTY